MCDQVARIGEGQTMTPSLTLAENLLLKYRFLIREDLPEKIPLLLGIAQITPISLARNLGNVYTLKKTSKSNWAGRPPPKGVLFLGGLP